VTDQRGTEPLLSGLKKAALHFSRAAIEVASGVGDLVTGITATVRPNSGDGEDTTDGPQKIEIE
jgi:hypothetical protein